jgi:hypothetical protein
MAKKLSCAAVIAAAALIAGQAHALSITSEIDAAALADALFLNIPGLSVTGATLTSGVDGGVDGGLIDFPSLVAIGSFQSGVFTNATGTYGLPQTGIVFSSGNVGDYGDGPNTEDSFTTDHGLSADGAQNALLSPITGQSAHFDPIQLDVLFDAGAGITSISFFAAFGSEEFPEFVGSSYIDGFGLFLNGTNVAGALQSGGVPGGPLLPININHPDMAPIGGTELDGVLAPNGIPVLRFDVPVTENSVNNQFTMILADASDRAYDTTIYLSSFIPTDPTGSGGETEFSPLLPSNPPDPETGTFIIVAEGVTEGTTVWIDPPVAIGYVYEVTGGQFATATAPSLATVPDADGYFVTVGATTVALAAGATLDFFATFGVTPTTFTLTGIDPALMLLPANPLAYPIGISLAGLLTSTPSFAITPIVSDVPVPGAIALYLSALVFGGLGLRRRAA